MTRWFWLGLGLALLAACGGGADRTKAQIRLVNASSGYSALDMSIDDTRRFSAVAYGATADYVEADPAKMASTISRPGSPTALLTFTPSVAKDQHYTLLAYGGEGSLAQLLLDDNAGEPDSGKALLRVVNAAPDAGAVDVYLTGCADALDEAVPLQADAEVGAVGGYVTVDRATWCLRVTGAGSKTDLRLEVPALALGDRQVATVVITEGRGGVLVNALLLVDRGAVTRADNAQARVRLVAAVSDGGTVSAAAGGTTLRTGIGAPAIDVYQLVTAGDAPVAVSVDGTAAALTQATLAPGGDYTLLVYGPPAAPQAAMLEDDNRLPTDATQAKLRLVHGLADVTGTLSLTVDYVPVADGVAQGRASAYASVEPTTTATLAATTPGVAMPIVNPADQTFVAGGTYSFFVVGASSAPVGILRKDR